jgi:two-component system cell cycle sensor histidine kinase/response regulator CckA
VHWTRDKAFLRGLLKALRAGHTWQGRIDSKRKDGALLTTDGSVTPVRDDDGRIANYVVVMRDVTQEVELETRSQQAQRMEALGALAGGVAHDLNNMLAPVLLESDVLMAGLAGGDPRQDRLRSIQDAATKARDLVRQLLLFGRQSTTAAAQLDMVAVVHGLERLLRTGLRNDVRLAVEIKEEPLPVRCDRSQVEQVLMNLVLNAQDAMPEGGSVRIRLSRGLAETDADLVTPAVAGSCAVLEVADTGTGMDEATRLRIFEPFFSTKGSSGTGLGLATTYTVVMAHDGAIAVTSAGGAGTQFRIYLPLRGDTRVDAGSAEAQSPTSLEQGSGEGRPLLIVEDDVAIRGAVTNLLRDHGYRTLAAGSVAAAAELLGTLDTSPCLVLTDVVLPDGTGRDVATHVLRRHPGTPLLFMSGHGRDHALEAGILRANDPLLTKPFTARELLGQVADLRC